MSSSIRWSLGFFVGYLVQHMRISGFNVIPHIITTNMIKWIHGVLLNGEGLVDEFNKSFQHIASGVATCISAHSVTVRVMFLANSFCSRSK